MPLNAIGWKTAYSLNKQSDIKTVIGDAQIDQMRDQEDFAPVTVERITRAGNRTHWGRGTQEATYDLTTQKLYRINAQTRPATDLDIAFAFGFVMGGLANSQPDALLLPNTWEHIFTWQDIAAATTERVYTSMLEEFGGGSAPGYRKKLTGVSIDQLTLRGEMGQLAMLSFQGTARKYATEASATLPAAITPASLFKVQRSTLKFGSTPAPAATVKWLAFEINLNANTEVQFREGQTASEEELMERMDTGLQDHSGSIVLELDDVYRAHMTDEDQDLQLEITLTSDDQVDSVDKSFVLDIQKLGIASEAFGLDGRTVTYTLTFDPASILVPAAGAIISGVLTTDIDDTELLVTDP